MAGLEQSIRQKAAAEGFASVSIARVADDPLMAHRLRIFLAEGRHGGMGWMADTEQRRASPRALWPEARSAIMLAQSYTPENDPLARLAEKSTGVISVYALNRDYHEVVKGKLKRLAQWLGREAACEVKVFVDTAPLMEKPLAQKSGLGWQGKHTNLVSRQLGSWFFIGAILTTAELAADETETDHCGSCRACLDICPTGAFPAPYQLDARRCISYLTIEHHGHIPREFRKPMGNRIYGCDDCLAVCPWNKYAVAANEAKLRARDDLKAPPLQRLLALDDAAFRLLFAGSPVKRTGRDRFIRNVLIAAGNSADATLVPQVRALAQDPSPLVRAMAAWALARLLPEAAFAELRKTCLPGENDPDVRQEWEAE